jgi:mono/diheme cytochrome c family protein
VKSALLSAGILSTLLFMSGCQQKMANQPSFDDFEPCAQFSDGMTAQAPPAGTVARGNLRIDTALFYGRISSQGTNDSPGEARTELNQSQPNEPRDLVTAELASYAGVVDEFPLPLDRAFVEHGRNRFMIYCSVCHDALGTGRGKIVERGYTPPPSYHIERLRKAPVGHFFRVISEGYGSMPAYGPQIPVRDRWAIVAYVRALQLSQHFPEGELTDQLRAQWQASDAKSDGS